jgi:hypothetical protein
MEPGSGMAVPLIVNAREPSSGVPTQSGESQISVLDAAGTAVEDHCSVWPGPDADETPLMVIQLTPAGTQHSLSP